MSDNKFDEFMNEVEQDLRQEKFEKMWQKYGKTITGVFAGLVISGGFYTLWQNYETKKLDKISEDFVYGQKMIVEGKLDEGIAEMLAVSNTSHKNYAALAKLNMAAIYSNKGPKRDVNKSIKIYTDIFSNKNYESFFRNIALIQLVSLKFENLNENFNQPESEISSLLQDLETLTDAKNPFRFLAMELKGIINIRLGDEPKACELFVKIAQDPQAPANISARAKMMSQYLGSKIAQK